MTWSEYVRRVIGDDRQVDVFAKTGIDQGTISRWLTADRPPVSPQAARAFARAYGRSVVEAFVVAGFLDESETEVPVPTSDRAAALSNEELAAELRKRLKALTTLTSTTPRPRPRPGT